MNQIKDFIDYIINAIKIWIIVQPWHWLRTVNAPYVKRNFKNGRKSYKSIGNHMEKKI